MKYPLLLALAAAASCSAAPTSNDTNGPFHLEVKDFQTQGGIFWALPSVTPSAGKIVVENTRYGSLCQFDVSGNAQTDGNKIAVHVTFSERLTACTADIRALRYTATLSEPAGTYDVSVIHTNGTQTDTLARRTVVVP